YQSTFRPNCICLASYVVVMVPNVAALRFDAGARKLSWCKRLSPWSRHCSWVRSPTAKFLLAARSNCQKPGPRTLLRGALPNGWLGWVAIATHAVLSQFVIDCWPAAAYGSQVTLGR